MDDLHQATKRYYEGYETNPWDEPVDIDDAE